MPKLNQYGQRARKLERRRGNRPPYPRVLIICEGHTEPNYFEEIRQTWRISSVHCRIVRCGDGSGPEKVVNEAEQRALQEKWEEVYCVFDRDDHHYYQVAIDKARLLRDKCGKKGKSFMAIPSDPCFELWFLLHFQEHTREEHRDQIQRLLRTHISDYRKGCAGMLKNTVQNLDEACKRAETLRVRTGKTGNSNPSTDVDFLVRRLNEIGKMNPLYEKYSATGY